VDREGAVASLAYSGDTGLNPDLVTLAQGVDLALFEASFVGREGPPDLHLTATQAAEHAAQAGAGRLLVTHLVAWNDDAQVLAEAQAAFPGVVELARPGLQVYIGAGGEYRPIRVGAHDAL
jgi:ribonuclease BN (tRNA processing enzyme)